MAALSGASLFEPLARAAERCMRNFSAQGLANTAWAFATVEWPDTPLFEVLARAAERRIGEFNT